jgi:hypothetical protein
MGEFYDSIQGKLSAFGADAVIASPAIRVTEDGYSGAFLPNISNTKLAVGGVLGIAIL